MTSDDMERLINHESIITFLKDKFHKIRKNGAVSLARMLLIDQKADIKIDEIKRQHKHFFRDNSSSFVEQTDEKTGEVYHILSYEKRDSIKKELLNIVEQIGDSMVESDVPDRFDIDRKQIEGVKLKQKSTFQTVRQMIDEQGKDVFVTFDFDDYDTKTTKLQDTRMIQCIDIHVDNEGQVFDLPLKYHYLCDECDTITTRYEYQVASTKRKIRCPHTEDYIDSNGQSRTKKCLRALEPEEDMTETKKAYMYNISFEDEWGKSQHATAISFWWLPKGKLHVAVQQIPRPYSTMMFHIVDYQPLNKNIFKMPERVDNEHYVFTLVRAIDNYIYEMTRYQHYGYLPIKIAMILQYAARYCDGVSNIFNIALTGSMSTGKSYFARYWGQSMYAEDSWSSNATSISIPKLRGTMESLHLFNKDIRYQYKGLLGEKDLIIIDELKEEPMLKNNLKQYAIEPTYEYSKQGSNNQTYERTAQLLITQNVDMSHLKRYVRAVKSLYQSDTLKPVDEDAPQKPEWDSSINLMLPLYRYDDNPYLKYAIRKVREEYAQNQMNWVDGSELALKQRFFFNFILNGEKTCDRMVDVIQQNSSNDIIWNSIDIMRIMDMRTLRKCMKTISVYKKGTNDIEYFKKADKILNEYEKCDDGRTRDMSYTILKLLRMIDGRSYCTEDDLRVFMYIIECIDNQVEVADTDMFHICGPCKEQYDVDEMVHEESESEEDQWGYSSNDEFDL